MIGASILLFCCSVSSLPFQSKDGTKYFFGSKNKLSKKPTVITLTSSQFSAMTFWSFCSLSFLICVIGQFHGRILNLCPPFHLSNSSLSLRKDSSNERSSVYCFIKFFSCCYKLVLQPSFINCIKIVSKSNIALATFAVMSQKCCLLSFLRGTLTPSLSSTH